MNGGASARGPAGEIRDPHLSPWSIAAIFLGAAAAVLLARELALGQVREKEPFQVQHLVRLRQEQPDIVLIGSSMGYSRIDDDLLNELIAPRQLYLMANPNTYTPRWYLQLKNYVVASGVKPRRTIIMFRDDVLTRPLEGLDGKWLRHAEREAHDREPVFERVTLEARDWRMRTGDRIVPKEGLREWSQGWVDRASHRVADEIAGPAYWKRRRKLVNALFDWELARPDRRVPTGELPPRRDVDFARDVEGSFLPEVLALAEEHGLSLFFLQIRTAAAARGAERSASLETYQADLERYLRSHGAGYRDLHDATWVTEEMFAEGDHIGRQERQAYTRLLVERVPEIFE